MRPCPAHARPGETIAHVRRVSSTPDGTARCRCIRCPAPWPWGGGTARYSTGRPPIPRVARTIPGGSGGRCARNRCGRWRLWCTEYSARTFARWAWSSTSSRSNTSRRRVPTSLSQTAFARGACGGQRMIRTPSAANTASNAAVNLVSRSRIRNRRSTALAPRHKARLMISPRHTCAFPGSCRIAGAPRPGAPAIRLERAQLPIHPRQDHVILCSQPTAQLHDIMSCHKCPFCGHNWSFPVSAGDQWRSAILPI